MRQKRGLLWAWCALMILASCACQDDTGVPNFPDMSDATADQAEMEDSAEDVDINTDVSTDLPTEDMPKDLPVLDMCEPEDVTNFCQGKCGIQQVTCTDNPQQFDCGPCDVASIEILSPVPKPDGEVFLNLGKDPTSLKARALDADGQEVPCEIEWTVNNTVDPGVAQFAQVVPIEDEFFIQPIAEGPVTLNASCEGVSQAAKLRMILPGYLPKATAFKVWLRPESGLKTNASGQVVAWDNSVVDGANFEPDGAARPTAQRRDLQEFDTVAFTGQQGLIAKTRMGTDPYVRFQEGFTIFSVLKADLARPLGTQVLFGGCDVDGSYQVRLQANVSNTLSYYHQLDPDNKPDEFLTSAASPVRLSDQFILLTLHVDGTNFRVRLNGQTVYVDDQRFLGQGRQFNLDRIGAWCQNTAGFQGRMAEILMFEVPFGAGDDLDYRAQIERYLMLKYNLF